MKEVKVELKRILDTMDIPKQRKNLIDWNIKWLSRNILIRNSKHPDINRALELIRILFFEKR